MTTKKTKGAARKPYTAAAQERYLDKIIIAKVTANPTTEPDIYEWLDTRENRSGELKVLIKKEIERLKRAADTKKASTAKSKAKKIADEDQNTESDTVG